MIAHVQNGKTEIACVLHMVAFLHCVCRPPCIANAFTARVICIAKHCHVVVTVTERSRAGGGSDPREGWAPSGADAGSILTKLLPRLGRNGHIHGARFPKMAHVRTKLWCAEHDPAAMIPFLSLRQAFHALIMPPPSVRRFPHFPPYMPFPPALLSTVFQMDQNRAQTKHPKTA